MADERTQANRQIKVRKPETLAEDVLLAWRLKGREEMSRPFEYELTMLSQDPDIAFADIIAKPLTLELEIPDSDTPRYFNGYVTRLEQGGENGKLNVYRARLSPWTWFLTKRVDCRIFQGKDVLEIFEAICANVGVASYKIECKSTYLKREYCVQYKETDFDFVSRLFEEEGIYYFYEYEAEKHVMVVCDDKSAHDPGPGEEVEVVEAGDVESWEFNEQPAVETYKHRDYDFERPTIQLEEAAGGAGDLNLEVFEYPGGFSAADADGHVRAQVRFDELTALKRVVKATSGETRTVQAGYKFTMDGHPRADQDGDYLTIAAEFEIEGDDYQGGGEVDEFEVEYKCRFLAIPSAQQYRPERRTRKPQIAGPQSALVVGSSGEEVDLDQYGRVKVSFHWDRESAGDENSSCWVRVVQPWAGNSFGAMFHPRVGQEVVVAFLDGDLDKPVVMGGLFNAVNMPPYDAVAKKTVTCIKSRSGDEDTQSNEIRFEDKAGEEQLFIHAAKALDLRAEQNMFQTVMEEMHVTVETDKIEQVKGESHLVVDGKRDSEVKGDDLLAVDGVVDLAAKGDITMASDGDGKLSATNVTIEGTSSIELKVGGSSIKIEAAKITIKSVEVGVEGDASAEIKAAMVKIDGSAMSEIKGGLVKIN